MKYRRYCTGLLLVLLFLVSLDAHAKIVFSSKREGDRFYHIYMIDDDGSDVQRITRPPFYDRAPRWFPDGKRIVFARDLESGRGNGLTSEFYIIDVSGLNEHRFMENHETDSYPVVSPDGKQIAFWSLRSGEFNIHVFDFETGDIKQLTHNLPRQAFSQYMDWSPDGKQIAYQHAENGTNIWIMNADGSRKRQFSPDPKPGIKFARVLPSWSPSGKYIMYIEEERTPEIGPHVATRLIIQNVQTGSRNEHHFPQVTKLSRGCWMGNDRTVLLSMTVDWTDPKSNFEIYRYELETRKRTNLTNQPGGDYRPHWISDQTFSVTPQGKKKVQWGTLKK